MICPLWPWQVKPHGRDSFPLVFPSQRKLFLSVVNPFRLFMVLHQTFSFQQSMYPWAAKARSLLGDLFHPLPDEIFSYFFWPGLVTKH
jgi:hypothetical protein